MPPGRQVGHDGSEIDWKHPQDHGHWDIWDNWGRRAAVTLGCDASRRHLGASSPRFPGTKDIERGNKRYRCGTMMSEEHSKGWDEKSTIGKVVMSQPGKVCSALDMDGWPDA